MVTCFRIFPLFLWLFFTPVNAVVFQMFHKAVTGVLNTCHIEFRTAAFRTNPRRRLSPALQDYHNDHNYTFFGAQYRACNLDPSSFRLPLPGLPVDFTTDLPAKL